MATKSETITENIFREFYGSNTFLEKSAIGSHYGFESKNRTGKPGYPDFFRDGEDDDFVIIVEAKADDYKAACEDVRFYAENNAIEKDIVTIAISGQSLAEYRAAISLLIQGDKWKEIPSNGELLSLKDIRQYYRIAKYG